MPETSARPLALVRPPSPRLDQGELTHLDREPVDTALALLQWRGYVAALAQNGFTPVIVDAADEHPDGVFIEDALVVFDATAVVTSPGAETRRGETASAQAAAEQVGLDVRAIELPGTLDGGDVLKVDGTVYAGLGGRTNADGIRQLTDIVTPLGYEVVTVPVTKVLHLKSGVTALPDGTVIGRAADVDDPDSFPRFADLPESGAAVVVLGPDAVLMSTSAPASAELFRERGYRVVTVDIGEFEKLEGCVTCLSVRVR